MFSSPHICRSLFALVFLASFCAEQGFGQNSYISAASSFDNRFEVFVETNHGIEHLWQSPNGQGLDWDRYGAPYQPSPVYGRDFGTVNHYFVFNTIVSGTDGTGRLMVAWIVNGQVYYCAAPEPGSSLNTPGNMIYDATNVASMVLARNQDGRLELFTLDSSGFLKSFRQQVAGVWAWSASTDWEAPEPLKMISASPHGDGRLAVVGITKANGSVVLMEQHGPNGTPELGFRDLQGHDLQITVAAQSIDHRLEVFAVGADNRMYHRWEVLNFPNSYQPWSIMGSEQVLFPIAVVSTGDGRMEVIAYNPRPYTFLVHAYQNAPNGSFVAAWTQLSLTLTLSPPIAYGAISAVSTPSGIVGLFQHQTTNGNELHFTARDSAIYTDQEFEWSSSNLVQVVNP